jgi:hypothetical protein
VALVATAGAVCFLTVSTLYDVSGFPHATYVFLYIAGLGAVAHPARSRPEPEGAVADIEDLPSLEPSAAIADVRQPAGVR